MGEVFRKVGRGLALAFFLTLAMASSATAQTDGPSEQGNVVTPIAARAGWVHVVNTRLGFSIDLPASMSEGDMSSYPPGAIDTQLIGKFSTGSWFQLHTEQGKSVQDALRDVSNSDQGVVQAGMMIAGRPGLAVDVQHNGGVAHYWIVSDGARIYVFAALVLSTEPYPTDAQAIIESLRFFAASR